MNFSFQDKSGKTVFSNTSLLDEKKVRLASDEDWSWFKIDTGLLLHIRFDQREKLKVIKASSKNLRKVLTLIG